MKTEQKQPAKPALKPKKKLSPKKVVNKKIDFDPNQHLAWTTKKIVLIVVLCFGFSLMLVFGFLTSAQFRKDQIKDDSKKESTGPTSNTKHYTNNYWGIELDYPSDWSQPIGSYADGEYYYASQPINFINELEPGEAIIALKTFNNWNSLSDSEWLKSQQWSFLPPGELSSPTATTVTGMPAQHYTLKLKTPQNNSSFWNIVIISRSTATKYVFILETDTEETNKKFQANFDAV
ncbi:MAG TPA: hypothetical protein VHQ20_02460, partial [Patescibacteria group bacterium]|nr:hypothetical protein [Patescibacteria group bacterium]